jgi:hypothetical protein
MRIVNHRLHETILCLGALLLFGCGAPVNVSSSSEGLTRAGGGVVCIPCGGGVIENGDEGGNCLPADSTVHIPHCNDGYGCNEVTNICEACGANGQPCCDGPHSAFSGKCYVDPLHPHACDVCNAGGSCNMAKHLCYACGSTAGGPCCAPDATFALYRCHGSLACDSSHMHCIACGAPGQPTCDEAPLCNASAVDDGNGHCIACGANGQPACAGGCQSGLEERNGVCVPICGKTGGVCCSDGNCDDRHDYCRSGVCQTEGYYLAPCTAEYCSGAVKCMFNDPFDYSLFVPPGNPPLRYHVPARVYNMCGGIDPNKLMEFYRAGYPGDSRRADLVAFALQQNFTDSSGRLTEIGRCGDDAIKYYQSDTEYCSEFVRSVYLWHGDVQNKCRCNINAGICLHNTCISDIDTSTDWADMFKAYGGWIDRGQVTANSAEPGDYVAMMGDGHHFGHSAMIVAVSVDGSTIWTMEGNIHDGNGPGCVHFEQRPFFVNGQLDGNLDGIGKVNVLF